MLVPSPYDKIRFADFNIFVVGKKLPSKQIHKANNRNTGKKFEIRSRLTIKKTKRRDWRHSGAFIVDSEHI